MIDLEWLLHAEQQQLIVCNILYIDKTMWAGSLKVILQSVCLYLGLCFAPPASDSRCDEPLQRCYPDPRFT